MLQLDAPWVLLLLPLPLLVFWLVPVFRDRGEALRAPFFLHLVELTGKTPTSGGAVIGKTRTQRLNGALTWVLVVLALARPIWAGDPVVQETAARDLLLVVDLSASMSTEDFASIHGEQVSRLEAVKQVLEVFIARREGDRLGLAVFGNAAFPQAPFTEDHGTVLRLLDELQVGMAGPKTMIGDAIGLAVRLFDDSTTNNKVVIMLTDGNDSGSRMPVARAAKIAAEKGITVHAIAMGDPATLGEAELDQKALGQISEVTGGKFFLALDRAQLTTIYQELDQLEPERIEILSYRPKRPLFHYLLAAMLVANLVLAVIMIAGARRRALSLG